MFIFRVIISLLFVFSACLFLTGCKVISANIIIDNYGDSEIEGYEDEYEVGVRIDVNSADGTKYYLRGVFFEPDTSRYCGYTWNGSGWYNGPYTSEEGWTKLMTVTISSSSAAVNLKAKLDRDDSRCQRNGVYNFKIQRYTQSGSSSFDNQNMLSINVKIPPSAVPPSITPTNVKPSVTKSILRPTNTPLPKATERSILPTSEIFNKDREVLSLENEVVVETGDFTSALSTLSSGFVSTQSGKEVSVSGKIEKINGLKSDVNFPAIFLAIGGLFMGSAAFVSLKKIKKPQGE
ncbi:hypothetical protein M1271_03640 [Patescibacteria group bacterium]|nr:hypothetical protein [Patescibacteria group bacterium]MCL5797814.1 hypothetical protein [Patescibacteria group bacterium]